MANKTFSADFSAITTIGILENVCNDTSMFFDSKYVEQKRSAIDDFINNCNEINKIWINNNSISPEFGRVLLLGYVSAVESFFRSIFKSIINNDEKASANAHSYPITYGAALFHKKEVLADALLEGYSFSGDKEIIKAFQKFLDIPNIEQEIKDLLIVFEKICQMRHCCVHRFGKLGSQNGIVLGLTKHKKALEKPLILDKISLGNLASWLISFTKAINNYIFKILLDKPLNVKEPYSFSWTWQYKKDKVNFNKIYQLCLTTIDASPSPRIEELYEKFKSAREPKKK